MPLYLLLFSTLLLAGSSYSVIHRTPSNLDSPVKVNNTGDPAKLQEWGLKQIEVRRAWKILNSQKPIVIAIIDTGVDQFHPDLKSKLWINPGESGIDSQGRPKAKNNIDDDGNGFVDDLHGWNFVRNNNFIHDQHGHGTHIAGIIGADSSNGIGIKGVAPNTQLMILKYYDTDYAMSDTLSATIKAIDYAINQGAHIINYSGGGLSKSSREIAALERARKKNILIVAAAGNERTNSDLRGYYPADYDLNNIISVTAINPSQQILASSNYGERTVDLAAPGQQIFSTLHQNRYGYMTGTSQATAFVSGVAALLMGQHPSLRRPQTLIKYLVHTGDRHKRFKGKMWSRATLNAKRALSMKGLSLSAGGRKIDRFPTTVAPPPTIVGGSSSGL